MSGNRGCVANSLLFLVIVFIPLLGHIIATIMVFEDNHSPAGTVLWLALIWLLPFLGSFLYLLFGQRRHRVMFGQQRHDRKPHVTGFGIPVQQNHWTAFAADEVVQTNSVALSEALAEAGGYFAGCGRER